MDIWIKKNLYIEVGEYRIRNIYKINNKYYQLRSFTNSHYYIWYDYIFYNKKNIFNERSSFYFICG